MTLVNIYKSLTPKEIIDRHDGRIWVESEFRKGSTFCFTLLLN
jgi:signal transduction histidine kinase